MFLDNLSKLDIDVETFIYAGVGSLYKTINMPSIGPNFAASLIKSLHFSSSSISYRLTFTSIP